MFSLIGRRYKMILKLILGYSYVINSPRSLIDSLKNKLNWSIGIMKKKKRSHVQEDTLKNLFNVFLKPFIDYAILLWGSAANIHY